MSWRVYAAIFAILGVAVLGIVLTHFSSKLNKLTPARCCEACVEARDSHNVKEYGTLKECEVEVSRLLNQLDDCYGGPVYRCCGEEETNDRD